MLYKKIYKSDNQELLTQKDGIFELIERVHALENEARKTLSKLDEHRKLLDNVY